MIMSKRNRKNVVQPQQAAARSTQLSVLLEEHTALTALASPMRQYPCPAGTFSNVDNLRAVEECEPCLTTTTLQHYNYLILEVLLYYCS